MNTHIYHVCLLCDAVLRGRRKWLWLAGTAALLLLAILLPGLSAFIVALVLLANAVLALYLLHRHHAFGAVYQRSPRPKDAQCETILIDTELIGQGTRLRAAAQPIDVSDSLSLRIGSGALLLGAAMTLTADDLPRADRAAILSAVQQLNIKPDRLRNHNPVLRREKADGVTIVTVRDGVQERRYWLGSPEELARQCTAIWEGHARPMTGQDPLRIADTARYIAQGNCRVLAWATALADEPATFLGMAGIGESIHMSAATDLSALRSMGLMVMLTPGTQSDADADALRTLLDLPDHHARADLHLTTILQPSATALCITRQPGDSLTAPIQVLRQHFSTIERTLRRFGVMLLFTLFAGVLSGSWMLCGALTAMVLLAAILIGVDLASPAPRWPILLGASALALAARVFLHSQPPAALLMAGGVIAVGAATTSVIRLCGQGFSLKAGPQRISAAFLGGAALLLLILVVFGLLQGSTLLPLGFALLIGAAISLLLIFEQKIIQ